jgi:hypothetical protein
VRGVPGPDCGLEPQVWEIDQHWLYRQTCGRLERRDQRPEVPDLEGLELIRAGVFGELARLVPEIVAGFGTLLQPDGDATPLRTVVTTLVRAREAIGQARRRRSHLAVTESAARVGEELDQMVRCYRAARAEKVPLQAQRHGEQAQRHIDRADDLADELAARLDAVDRLDATSSASIIQSFDYRLHGNAPAPASRMF